MCKGCPYKLGVCVQAMQAADSGVYCGPLRLLAMEVFDSCNSNGTICSLYTGQERKEVQGARHAACTVEMVSTTRRWDVAVIDEIQVRLSLLPKLQQQVAYSVCECCMSG